MTSSDVSFAGHSSPETSLERRDGTDPVHERFGDDTLRLLAPVLIFKEAPELLALATLIENHPMRSARPGGIMFPRLIEAVKWYCEANGGEWIPLREQIDNVVG